jgi:hypothetical protein
MLLRSSTMCAGISGLLGVDMVEIFNIEHCDDKYGDLRGSVVGGIYWALALSFSSSMGARAAVQFVNVRAGGELLLLNMAQHHDSREMVQVHRVNGHETLLV